MKYIYVFRNIINDKVYVGQTYNPSQRKAGHLNGARKGHDHPFYRSIRKYGEENFNFEVIEECNDSDVDEREKFWIAHYDSTNRDKGYNLERGGKGVSKEHRRKLSQALKGNKHCVGRKISNETRWKTGAAHRGKTLSKPHRANLSKTRNERGLSRGENNPMYGLTGERCPNSKLTSDQIRQIRKLRDDGMTFRLIAALFGVSRQTVSRQCH